MANIHFSLAGEGRGHAARARTLIEALRGRHRITVHTFGDALEMLEPLYGGTDVEVRRIPGLRFQYGRSGRVDYFRSTLRGFGTVAALVKRHGELKEQLVQEGADLVLSDFEPSLPRAARAAGIPWVAVDHQSVLAHGDLSDLPRSLRAHAAVMGAVVRRWSPTPAVQVSSSFYRPRPARGSAAVRFVGVLLREAVRRARSTHGEHLVAYLRHGTPQAALDVLACSPREVRVYGLPEFEDRGALRHRRVSEAGFVDDLASCRAVVTTAGNQLVGEAIHLGKPVLAMPEPGNREQEINAWFLESMGAGRSIPFSKFDRSELLDFLRRLPGFTARAARLDVDGTQTTLGLIDAIAAGELLPPSVQIPRQTPRFQPGVGRTTSVPARP